MYVFPISHISDNQLYHIGFYLLYVIVFRIWTYFASGFGESGMPYGNDMCITCKTYHMNMSCEMQRNKFYWTMHLSKIEQAVPNALLPFAMYMMIRSVHAKRYLYKQYCIHQSMITCDLRLSHQPM